MEANQGAVAFYTDVGFVPLAEVALERGTAIRMRFDIGAPGTRRGSHFR